jgi:hypothetical protein
MEALAAQYNPMTRCAIVRDRDIKRCCGIVGLMLNAMMDQGYHGGQLVGCHRLRKDAIVSA